MNYNLTDEAVKHLEMVGSCSTWHIYVNSEGCTIEISGLPVLIKYNETQVVFYKSDNPYVNLSDAIIQASEKFWLECYDKQKDEIFAIPEKSVRERLREQREKEKNNGS